jgi:hypothetical protein
LLILLYESLDCAADIEEALADLGLHGETWPKIPIPILIAMNSRLNEMSDLSGRMLVAGLQGPDTLRDLLNRTDRDELMRCANRSRNRMVLDIVMNELRNQIEDKRAATDLLVRHRYLSEAISAACGPKERVHYFRELVGYRRPLEDVDKDEILSKWHDGDAPAELVRVINEELSKKSARRANTPASTSMIDVDESTAAPEEKHLVPGPTAAPTAYHRKPGRKTGNADRSRSRLSNKMMSPLTITLTIAAFVGMIGIAIVLITAYG